MDQISGDNIPIYVILPPTQQPQAVIYYGIRTGPPSIYSQTPSTPPSILYTSGTRINMRDYYYSAPDGMVVQIYAQARVSGMANSTIAISSSLFSGIIPPGGIDW
jgi:hypothetical protein